MSFALFGATRFGGSYIYYTISARICQGVLGKFFLVKMPKKPKQNCANRQALEIRVVPAPQTPARPDDLFISRPHSLFILYHTFGHLSRGLEKKISKKFSTRVVENSVENLWISGSGCIPRSRQPLPQPHSLLLHR